MRELNLAELDFVCGGYDENEDIIVTGRYPPPPPPIYFPPSYSPPSYPPSYGGGGGSYPPTGSVVATHTEDKPCNDGEAVSVAEHIKQIVAQPGTDYENLALLTKTASGIGVYRDSIYTSYSPTYVGLNVSNIPASDWANMTGSVHNHPWNSSDYYKNLINRFPSGEDWQFLDKMVANGANPANLSLYLVDPWGEVREYPYSQKDALNAMTDPERMELNSPKLGAAPTPCGG